MTVFEKAARLPQKQPKTFTFVVCLLIVVLSLVMYVQTWKYRYLDWDDNTLVEQNIYVMQPSWQHTVDMFVPGRIPGPHLPVRSATYVADFELYGDMSPTHHHVTNTWLYALDGLLLFWICRKLLNPWAGAIAALIWIAHPVHVEGVSWVSGRKEMLSAALMFGTFLCYVYGTERLDRKAVRRRGPMIASLALTLGATLVSVLWAHYPQFQAIPWKFGFASLGLLLAATAVYPLAATDDPRKARTAALLFAGAALLSLGAQLSKPVALAIGPVLLAWELGYREPTARKPGDPPPPLLPDWWPNWLPTLAEAQGMVARMLPQIAICAWSAYITMFRAGVNQVVKDNATWNAAPKHPLIAAMSAIWLDVYHLVAPLDLSSLYDVKSDHWYLTAYAGVLILLALPVLTGWLLWKSPKALVWLAWWVFPLVMVSGIVPIAAAHADRYLFLPAIALAVALGILLTTAAFGNDEETGEWERWMAAALSVAIIGGFSILSWQRAHVWANDRLLWGDAVRKNPDLPSARNNYGAALMNSNFVTNPCESDDCFQGGALEQYYKAYQLLPTLDVAQFNIAATEMRLGHPEKAVKYGEEFVKQHAEMPTGWILIGQIYSQVGRATGDASYQQKAQEAYGKGCDVSVDKDAILQRMDKASSCNQEMIQFFNMGNTTGAEMAYQTGLQAQPGNKQLMLNKARFLQRAGHLEDAQQMITALWNANPNDPEVIRSLVYVLNAQCKFDDALEHLQTLPSVTRPTPDDTALMQQLQDAVKNHDTACKKVQDELKNATAAHPAPTPAPHSAAVPHSTPVARSAP